MGLFKNSKQEALEEVLAYWKANVQDFEHLAEINQDLKQKRADQPTVTYEMLAALIEEVEDLRARIKKLGG